MAIEAILNYAIEKLSLKLEQIQMPEELKFRQGITKWKDEKFSEELKKCCRIYPQDNNSNFTTDGFFIAKLRKK